MYHGIVIPRVCEEDFNLALCRREAKSLRQATNAFFREKTVAFCATRDAGRSARCAIATSFLERIGFPLEEFGGDICKPTLCRALSIFTDGLSQDARLLLSFTKKRLKQVADERGVQLTCKSSLKIHMVREIVESVSDQALFDRNVAESQSLRQELRDLLLEKTRDIVWRNWRNCEIDPPAEFALLPDAKTADIVKACLDFRHELFIKSIEAVASGTQKRARYDSLVQMVNVRSGMKFASTISPGETMPDCMYKLLDTTVSLDKDDPMDAIHDFCHVVKDIQRIGVGVSSAADTSSRHIFRQRGFGDGRQFCFETPHSGPLKFFDNLPAEVNVRIAEFLVDHECPPLVAAVPSLRGPVYARLGKNESVRALRTLSPKMEAERNAREAEIHARDAAMLVERRMRWQERGIFFGEDYPRHDDDDLSVDMDDEMGNIMQHMMLFGEHGYDDYDMEFDDDDMPFCEGCGDYHN